MLKSVNLSMEQQTAVDLCSDRAVRIASVTGGAGTGKSTILRRIYDTLREHFRADEIALAAPTGRAAKRIREVTGIPAVTLHRLLEFPMPEEDGDPSEPKRCSAYPLTQKVILVDEASMIGATLYEQLLNACRGSTLLRFFGDNNQLPPVESGRAPFVELLQTKPAIWLTLNYRSNDELISNALRVLEGRIPLRNKRFEIIYDRSPLQTLLDYVCESHEYRDVDHQIIMPTRNGSFGTERINPSLQLKLNPAQKRFLRLPRREEGKALLPIRVGDKVLWTQNDYQLEMFNGDVATVMDFDEEHGDLWLATEDRDVHVPPLYRVYSPWHGHKISRDPRKSVELGYAITTHKAQGSEFNTIIVCLVAGQGWLLNRRNLYTAITRARDRVLLITDRTAMGRAVRKGRDE